MRKSVSFASVVALSALVASAQANLIQNGGFESPLVTPGGYSQYNSGDTFDGGWVVGGHDIDLVSSTYAESGIVFNSNSGLASIDLTGGGNTGANSVSQIIPTSTGMRYTISFYVGRAQSSTTSSYTGPASILLSVGDVNQTFTNSNVLDGGIQWTLFTTSFVAQGSSTTVTFTNQTTGISNLAGLDDVNVTAAPAPGAMAVFGLGLLGRARRRSRRA